MTTPLVDAWHVDDGDPGVRLFTACLRAWRFDLPPRATVLELGCHESRFAAHLKAARPDVTVIGMDVRETAKDGPSFAGDRLIVGDAGAFETWDAACPVDGPGGIDAVVALSSIEHFGLGWYGDPAVKDADARALDHATTWLKPTGWLYYDVPWSRVLPYMQTGHYRRYTDATLPHVRAGGYVEHARTWVQPEREAVLLPGPPDSHDGNPHPFHYVAVWAGVR